MILPRDFKDILAVFAAHKVEYMVVGGYVVAFHGEPRFTKERTSGSTARPTPWLARAAPGSPAV